MEIRLHGRGGQGVVKAAEIIVRAAVLGDRFGVSIPFFGFERQGAPVTAFVRLADVPIRPKTRVYHPNCILVMDEPLLETQDVFEGLLPGATLVLNSSQEPSKLIVPESIRQIATVDASAIASKVLGRSIPNTTMLGAFCSATGEVKLDLLADCAMRAFGEQNAAAVREGFSSVKILTR